MNADFQNPFFDSYPRNLRDLRIIFS